MSKNWKKKYYLCLLLKRTSFKIKCQSWMWNTHAMNTKQENPLCPLNLGILREHTWIASCSQYSTKMNFQTIIDYQHTSPEHSNRYFKAGRMLSEKLQQKRKSRHWHGALHSSEKVQTLSLSAWTCCLVSSSTNSPLHPSDHLRAQNQLVLFFFASTSFGSKAYNERARDIVKNFKRGFLSP